MDENRKQAQRYLNTLTYFEFYRNEETYNNNKKDYWVNSINDFIKKIPNSSHLVFDSFEKLSVKDFESIREVLSEVALGNIELAPITPPKQPERTIPKEEVLKKEPPQEGEEGKGPLPEDIYKQSIERAEEEARKRAAAAQETETTTLPESVPEKIYVTPKEKPQTLQLTKDEAQALLDDVNAAVEDPGRFAATLTEESLQESSTQQLLQGIEPETATEIVHTSALGLTENLINLGQSLPVSPEEKLLALTEVTSKNSTAYIIQGLTNSNNPSLIKVIPDPATRKTFAEAAQNIALGSASNNDLAQAFFNKAIIGYSPDIFYPTTITNTDISLEPSNNSFEVNTSNFIRTGNALGTTYQEREGEDGGIDIGLDDIKKLKNLKKYVKRDWNSIVKNFESRGWRSIKSFFREIKYSITGQVPTPTTTAVGRISFTSLRVVFSDWTSSSTQLFGYSKTLATKLPQFSEPVVVGLIPESTTASTAVATQITTPYTVADSSGKIIAAGVGVVEKTSEAALAATSVTAGTEAVAIGTAEVAATGTGAAVGTGAGTAAGITGALSSLATPIIGLIVAALTFILVKAWPWIKKHWKELVLAVLAIAAILISPVFIIPAIFLVAGMFVTGSAAVTGITGVLGTMFVGFNALVVNSILVPLLIILFVVPILIALIIFIINSGAYVVPPDSMFGLYGPPTADVSSPWIGVEKTASPNGPFDNSDLDGPLEVTYNVRVWAKKAALTNITFENNCRIRKEDASPGCTHPIPETDDNDDTNTPVTISPGEDYTFPYTATYDNHDNFDDSFVIDTFKVIADAPDQPGAFASSSETIAIGDPPSDCPNGWPINIPIVIIQGPGGAYSHIGLEALDFRTPRGTPIYSTHSGAIIAVRSGIQAGFGSGYGNYVQIQSTCDTESGYVNFSSLYAHFLSIKPEITVGASIEFGDQIGTANDTGYSSEDHLHYEFRGLNMGPPYVDRIR